MLEHVDVNERAITSELSQLRLEKLELETEWVTDVIVT